MTAQAFTEIELAERELLAAGTCAVIDIPSLLTRAASRLRKLNQSSRSLPPDQRAELVSRLHRFQDKLRIFSRVMDRSETIFRGYSRLAGVESAEYQPGGLAGTQRDPAFLNLSA